jgi:hypothetical protein
MKKIIIVMPEVLSRASSSLVSWIPAYAGMTSKEIGLPPDTVRVDKTNILWYIQDCKTRGIVSLSREKRRIK